MRRVDFICKSCGVSFTSKKACKTRTPGFCSSKCFGSSIAKPKVCFFCKIVFVKYQNKKYCSVACATNGRAGWRHSESSREQMSRIRLARFSGEPIPIQEWDNVGYGGIHSWVRRALGKPKTCVFCGVESNRLQWANKTGKYLREAGDWLRLCGKCHYWYDRAYQIWRTNVFNGDQRKEASKS